MSIRGMLDPVVIVGTLVSIIVSLVLFIADIDPIYSVIFGLLGVAISLLIDLIARTTQLESRVLGIVNLSHQLIKDHWFYERLVM